VTNVSTLPRQTRREFKLSHDGGTSKACPPRTKKFARQPIMCLGPRKATSWLSCCQLPVLAAEVSVDIPWSNVPYNRVPVSVCRSLFACFHKTTAATIEKHREKSRLCLSGRRCRWDCAGAFPSRAGPSMLRTEADAQQLCHIKQTFSWGLRFRECLRTSKGPKRFKIKTLLSSDVQVHIWLIFWILFVRNSCYKVMYANNEMLACARTPASANQVY